MRKNKRGRCSYRVEKLKNFIHKLVDTPMEGEEGLSETVAEMLATKFAETVKRLNPKDASDRREIIGCVQLIARHTDPIPKAREEAKAAPGNPELDRLLSPEEEAEVERRARVQ